VPAPSQPGPLRTLTILATLILTGVILYYAQRVLIPVALAILLTFVLAPVVAILQRRRLPRTPAVLVTVFATFVIIGLAGWLVTVELHSLARELPNHQANITRKIASLQGTGGGVLDRLKDMWQEVSGELEKLTGENTSGQPPAQLVRIQKSEFSWFPDIVGPVVEAFAMALLVVMLVIFMLIRREDLRNRVLRLMGKGRLGLTTRALDDATQRISRFLVMQSIINLCFGTALMIGLFFIGVRYAFLWGLLAAILRFVPYVGTWIAMLLPLTISFAVSTGWLQPILVLVLFICLELATANAIEPLLLSHSTGISPIALLVAVVFWTWLWGPIGLVMATPLTTCLVVMGKFVPQLEFFDVLLGDEQVLETEIMYYQRLLARDHDEASLLVEEYLAHYPVDRVYDEMLLPALILVKRDRQRGDVTAEDQEFIVQATRDILDDVVIPQQQIKRAATAPLAAAEQQAASQAVLFGCPARDDMDELALRMFAEVAAPVGYRVEVVPPSMLSSEILSWVKENRPALVCIAALPPGGIAHARYLCKRLRAQFPELKILIGRWGQADELSKMVEGFRSLGADFVSATLLESRSQVAPLSQTVPVTAAQAG
jgi:predicted PurR-regulated permease PerM